MTGDPLLPWLVAGLIWGGLIELVGLSFNRRPAPRPSPRFGILVGIHLAVALSLDERTQIFALAAGIAVAIGLTQLAWWRQAGSVGRTAPGAAPVAGFSRDPG